MNVFHAIIQDLLSQIWLVRPMLMWKTKQWEYGLKRQWKVIYEGIPQSKIKMKIRIQCIRTVMKDSELFHVTSSSTTITHTYSHWLHGPCCSVVWASIFIKHVLFHYFYLDHYLLIYFFLKIFQLIMKTPRWYGILIYVVC